MTPLTTRARELAARERKLYDQRTIPAVLEELADEVERLMNLVTGYEEAQASSRKLTREIDVALHGEDGAAKQASLCDLVHPAAALRAEAANSAAQRDEAIARAEVAEERLRAVEAENEAIRVWTGKTVNDLAIKWHSAEAELARIRAADRTSITVRTTEAAKMRKGQAI